MASALGACSAASAELSLGLSKLASGTPCSMSNGILTAGKSSDCAGPVFRAMLTSGKLVPGISLLATSWSAGSLAKTFPLQGQGPESTASVRASGPSMPASLANYDPASSSWKTSQRSLSGELNEFSGTWPDSGMMHGGKLYLLPASEPGISAIVSSSSPPRPVGWERPFPTPTASDAWAGDLDLRKCHGWENGRGWTLGQVVRRPGKRGRGGINLRTAVGGSLNPLWEEWLMGFPPGWTDVEVLETPSCRKWLDPSAFRSFAGGGPIDA